MRNGDRISGPVLSHKAAADKKQSAVRRTAFLRKRTGTLAARGVKYYQGDRSPNDAERRENGVRLAWLHHKGRNRHHFEYWIDYCIDPDGKVYMGGCKMPLKYVAEMFCDRIAACKVYQGEKYTDASAYDYYVRSQKHILIHPETGALIEKMLLVLKEEGEDAAFAYVRSLLAQERKANAR